MIVEIYRVCPNCNQSLGDDSKFCPECGVSLEWQTIEEYMSAELESNAMSCGSINCDCGQQFYFETVRDLVLCISCNKEHDVSEFLKAKSCTEEEGFTDGTGI